jgi:deoxycytidylate deaminase
MSCAKTRVRCTIFTMDGRHVVGENDCLNPQEKCPRDAFEGYDKCFSICRQVGHAEQVALATARAAGYDLKNAIAIVEGISHVCRDCQEKLYDAGVTFIGVDKTKI